MASVTGLVKEVAYALKTASGVGLLTMTDSTVAAGRFMVTGESGRPGVRRARSHIDGPYPYAGELRGVSAATCC